MKYSQQTILLASKHEKERAIAPAVHEKLRSTLCVRDFDTDRFGTFTGEIPRTTPPYEACKRKAEIAAAELGFDLVIASEGSFGPHPAIPFIPADHEIMLLFDKKEELVIAEQLLSQSTNFCTVTLDSREIPNDFLIQSRFPDHALIVQTAPDKQVIAKGIQCYDTLNRALDQGFEQAEILLLSTDMRAMMNPTRMSIIGELASRLVCRILTPCPTCKTPGFGFRNTHGTLPCGACGTQTNVYAHEIWGCVRCPYEEYRSRKDAIEIANPASCPYCNP